MKHNEINYEHLIKKCSKVMSVNQGTSVILTVRAHTGQQVLTYVGPCKYDVIESERLEKYLKLDKWNNAYKKVADILSDLNCILEDDIYNTKRVHERLRQPAITP